jgi:hypothetical protein
MPPPTISETQTPSLCYQLQLGDKIGSGRFGAVYTAFFKEGYEVEFKVNILFVFNNSKGLLQINVGKIIAQKSLSYVLNVLAKARFKYSVVFFCMARLCCDQFCNLKSIDCDFFYYHILIHFIFVNFEVNEILK